MWVELGIPKPGTNLAAPNSRTWLNTNYIVNAKFDFVAGKAVTVEVVSTKPGGCDRTIFRDDDAERLYLTLEHEREATTTLGNNGGWRPLLIHEKEALAVEEATKKELSLKSKPKTSKTAKKS